jgi:6-phosphofructokinase
MLKVFVVMKVIPNVLQEINAMIVGVIVQVMTLHAGHIALTEATVSQTIVPLGN